MIYTNLIELVRAKVLILQTFFSLLGYLIEKVPKRKIITMAVKHDVKYYGK